MTIVKHVDVYVQVEEGKKYYIRNITWVGNTVYTTDQLSRVLGMKKGDVYNQKLLNKRLSEDEDAVGNLYWNNGYLFYNLQPTEINIVGDSIDLETSWPKAKLTDYIPFVKTQMADCYEAFDAFRKKHPEFHEMHFMTEQTVWEKDLEDIDE